MKKSSLVLLILYGVFSQAQIFLEYECEYAGYFTQDILRRTKLDYSGEKYFYKDAYFNGVNIFNTNYSLWKTIDFPESVSEVYDYVLSEHIVNNDNLIEILYRGYPNNTIAVFQEDGTELFSTTNLAKANYSIIEGLNNKLIGNVNETTNNVYSLPAFTLEHTYSGRSFNRIKLDTNQEIYYTFDTDTQSINVYNSDHVLWKSVQMPESVTILSNKFFNITHMSVNTINADDLLEIMFVYTDIANHNHALLIDENSSVLLSTDLSYSTYTSNAYIDEMNGEEKIVHYFENDTYIYSIPSMELEKHYSGNCFGIANLEMSGDKYYIWDTTDYFVKLFNPDHTLWKTLVVPIEEHTGQPWIQESISRIFNISETFFNFDNQLEIFAHYHYEDEDTLFYREDYKITNEDEDLLFHEFSTDSSGSYSEISVNLSQIQGLNPKILTTWGQNNEGFLLAKVFDLKHFIGVSENPINDNINIVPNPFESIITISNNSKDNKVLSFTIFDSKGTQIMTKSNVNNSSQLVDLQQLKTGLYYIKFSLDEGVFTKKIIKM